LELLSIGVQELKRTIRVKSNKLFKSGKVVLIIRATPKLGAAQISKIIPTSILQVAAGVVGVDFHHRPPSPQYGTRSQFQPHLL